MSYRIEDEIVRWKNKRLKADAASFEILVLGLARDNGQVFYLGKVQKLCPKTIQRLDETYLKDDTSVFLIMASKLKPLKADALSFQSLGGCYGRDAKKIFWKDKWVRHAHFESFQSLENDLGADQKGVFRENHRRVKTKSNVIATIKTWRTGRYGWMRVGEKAYYLDYDWAQEMPTPDWNTFRPLAGYYARDEAQMYFRDRICEDVHPSGHYKLVDEDEQTITNGEHCICFGHLGQGMDAKSATTLDEYILDQRAIYDTCGGVVAELRPGPSLEFNKLVKKILQRQFLLLERLHPLGSRPDPEWYESQETQFQANISVSIEEESLVLECEGHRYFGPFLALPRLASRLWTAQVYGQEFDRFLHETGVSYPDGALQLKHLLQVCGADVATVIAEHFPSEAHELAILVTKLLWKDTRLPFWSRLPYSALSGCHIPYPDSCVTTNLARAREILQQKTLFHKELRTRQGAAFELYGLAESSNKTAHFLKDVAPEVIKAWEAETCQSLKFRWLAVLGQIASSAFVSAEVRGENHYAQVMPILSLLVKEGFNLDLNLARLCECELHKSGESQSRNALLKLTKGRRMSPMWSGLHGDFPSADFWLLAACIRTGYHRPKAKAQDTLDAVMSGLDRLRTQCGEASIFAALLNEADDFARHFKLKFEHISAPKEQLYTSLSHREYTTKKADYWTGELLWDKAKPGQFVLEGWPWGRQISINLQIGSWRKDLEVALGLITELPVDAPRPQSPQDLKLS